MTGHIRKRGDTWSLVVELDKAADGKRRQKWYTVRGSKKDAERELNRIIHEVNSGRYVEPVRKSTGEYLDEWLTNVARDRVSAKTFERYESIVRCSITPRLGEVPLPKLTPSHIMEHYSWLGEHGRVGAGRDGLAARSILHTHRVLRKALNDAVTMGVLASNPTDAVKPPRVVRPQAKALSKAQAQELLRLLDGDPLFLPVLIALTTGMRRGEILALSWDQVDLGQSPRVTVTRSVEQTSQRVVFKEPKTAQGRRTIPIPGSTARVLNRHRIAQARQRLQDGEAYVDNNLVCCASEGSIWRPDTLTSCFRKKVRALGGDFEGLRFHDLRHTHATLLMLDRIPAKVVSERLGHSSVSITLDVYSHVLSGMQEEAADAIEEALNLTA